ncbi:hypothetical protein [Legionella fallonii]|uniref:Protein kinase domain-containing protein n=1 Tax=Legionella fallonii LLAP-10 TaxID=1212491 RepID=A0A098G6D6_9GAMM|nr:hypothetical protein [Legionella fallonii]CEG57529.1 conserved protein of unknown function [Legionella fallonii LLAP-10]
MALALPQIIAFSSKNRKLIGLVNQFNKLPEDDHIKRLFHLQKINYVLNTMPQNIELYDWINNPGEKGWFRHLEMYGINPHASFFMKGLQFAQAVCAKIEPVEMVRLDSKFKEKLDVDNNKGYEYPLMQERDQLLKNEQNEQWEELYIANCYQLATYSARDQRIQTRIKLHSEIVEMAKKKIHEVQGKDTSAHTGPTPSYHTKVLGAHTNNNANFEFKMGGWKDLFVFRVEDRAELGLEQDLHSFEVSKYFIEDFAVFVMPFKTQESPIELKPVVLSQFANQGSLADLASALHKQKESMSNIGPITADYFTLLSHFCLKLIETKTYHPDIKLTNFLAHNNLIRVSDRKTFVREEEPLVNTLRVSPEYAPDEIINCLNEDWTGYNATQGRTKVNMPAVMAYQLGMALKEFLILTQLGEHPDDFRKPERTAISYFTSATKETRETRTIMNLSLLVQELTRSEPEKRLSIRQFHELLHFRMQPSESFYQKLEELLPSKNIGIQEDVDAINNLLNGDLADTELLTQANQLFIKLFTRDSIDHRLTRLAEKLAIKCYRGCAESFFTKSIEAELLNRDWQEAPWYRKFFHIFSFGFFRVEKVTRIEDIKDSMGINLEGEEFQTYFSHLMFLPPSELESLGRLESIYFKDLINDNLDKIVVKNPDLQDVVVSDDEECAEQRTSTTSLPRTTLTLSLSSDSEEEEDDDEISATIKINYNATDKQELSENEKEKIEGPLPSGTTVIHHKEADKEDGPLPTSTTVIHHNAENKKENPKKREGLASRFSKLNFFGDTPSSTTHERVQSFKSTLERGDGSGKGKSPNKLDHRVRIKDINFEPPMPDELEEELTSTPMLQA